MDKKVNVLDVIALILVVVGGLNWGLVGLFKFNLVDAIFGGIPVLARIVYVVVGVAALYTAVPSPKLAQSPRPAAPPATE